MSEPELTPEQKLMKQAFEAAARQFLNETFAVFGKWTFLGVCAMGLTALTYFILTMKGWHQ